MATVIMPLCHKDTNGYHGVYVDTRMIGKAGDYLSCRIWPCSWSWCNKTSAHPDRHFHYLLYSTTTTPAGT